MDNTESHAGLLTPPSWDTSGLATPRGGWPAGQKASHTKPCTAVGPIEAPLPPTVPLLFRVSSSCLKTLNIFQVKNCRPLVSRLPCTPEHCTPDQTAAVAFSAASEAIGSPRTASIPRSRHDPAARALRVCGSPNRGI